MLTTNHGRRRERVRANRVRPGGRCAAAAALLERRVRRLIVGRRLFRRAEAERVDEADVGTGVFDREHCRDAAAAQAPVDHREHSANHRCHGQPGQIPRDVGSGQADVGRISKRRAKHTERRRRDQQCRDGEDNRHNSSWPMPASARLFHANAGLTGEQLCTGQRCERGRSADAAFGHCGRRTGRGLR